MPEGPEVKRCADLIRDHVESHDIKSITSLSSKGKFKDLPEIELPSKIKKVLSYGKAIYIILDEGKGYFKSTLGMCGWWYPDVSQIDKEILDRRVYDPKGQNLTVGNHVEKALKSARFVIETTSGKKIYYVDQRNYGNFKYIPGPSTNLLNDLRNNGYDMLHPNCQLNDVVTIVKCAISKTKYSNLTVAEFLLDQSVICGFGNIYRAETMYLADINPFTQMKDLFDSEIRRLFSIGQYVLHNAYVSESSMSYDIETLMNLGAWSQVSEEIKEKLLKAKTIIGHVAYGRVVDIFGVQIEHKEIKGRTLWFSSIFFNDHLNWYYKDHINKGLMAHF